MRRLRRPTALRRLLGVAIVLTAASGLLTGCALFDRHSQLTIAMLMDDEGYTVDVTTNPVDITETACVADLNCIEAYSTDEANYYRFPSRDAAASYAQSVEGGFAVHYIAMDFSGKDEASGAAQRSAMERLAGAWQDYDGPFPTR